jgi:hypothetical protein
MDILVFFLFMLLGSMLFGLLAAAFEYLFWKSKGYTFLAFVFYFAKWYRDYYDEANPGKLKVTASSRIQQVHPQIAMFSHSYPPEKERRHIKVYSVIYLVLGVCCLALNYGLIPWNRDAFYTSILQGLIGGGFCLFVSMGYYGLKNTARVSNLAGRTRDLGDLLRNEEKLLSSPMPAFDYLEYGKAPVMQRVPYLCTYYLCAEIKNDLPALAQAANAFSKLNTATLTDAGHFSVDTTMFGYYSFREKNPSMATRHYSHSMKNIDADMDCNGRRKLAYYAFYILEDKDLARTYLEQGLRALKVVDPRITPAHLHFEERMLNYLKSQLESD